MQCLGMGGGGESVKVVLRVRPMSNLELSRNDENIVAMPDPTHVHVNLKGQLKSYYFNATLQDNLNQTDVFNSCGVDVLV